MNILCSLKLENIEINNFSWSQTVLEHLDICLGENETKSSLLDVLVKKKSED
jgi:hypothetical protein